MGLSERLQDLYAEIDAVCGDPLLTQQLPGLNDDLILINDRIARAVPMLAALTQKPPPPDAVIPSNREAADAGGMVAGESPAQVPVGELRNTAASAEPLRVKASDLRPVSRRLLELVLEVDALDRRVETLVNLLDGAWGIIANASDGNWNDATSDWQNAARAWRDEYHAL